MEVEKGFDDEDDALADPKDERGVKRKASDVFVDRQRRHCSWLQRVKGKKASLWRPKKRYRTAAKRYLTDLDTQLRISTNHQGLSLFKKDVTVAAWQSPFSWPALSIAMDLGSVGNCAFHALAYKEDWKLNIWQFPDQSHAGNCDEVNTLKDMKLFDLWLLLLVSANLVYGPRDDNYRLLQLQEAMTSCFATESARTCPLFQAYAPGMIKSLTQHGELHVGDNPEADLWEFLKGRMAYVKAGRRINMNRFQGAKRAIGNMVPFWEVYAFERQYCALELDMMFGKKFMEQVCFTEQEKNSVGQEDGTTDPARLRIQDRGMKSATQNALVTSAICMGNLDNKRIVQARSL